MGRSSEPKPCPCCGGRAYHAVGNQELRIPDRVHCGTCFLEVEVEYEPYAARAIWDKRVDSDAPRLTLQVWLDEELTLSPEEQQAKEWLNRFCQSEYNKYVNGTIEWLAARKLTVVYEDKRYRVTGGSVMGDVWLKELDDTSTLFYCLRVCIDELTDWETEILKLDENTDISAC